jgi:hypothetical protein
MAAAFSATISVRPPPWQRPDSSGEQDYCHKQPRLNQHARNPEPRGPTIGMTPPGRRVNQRMPVFGKR